ncbi:MAG: nucleotidyltransferase family protein [Phycisphaerales bacterium]|nr:nucleotidyltransferase family protein [Phycisphaerales bacterium]
MSSRRVFAMILAAGQSRRMGELKQLMPYGHSTMLETVIESVLESPVDGLVLVTNPQIAPTYQEYLPDLCFVVVNDDENSEMLASVQLGLRRIKEECAPAPTDGIMVLLADQPQIRAGTLATCAETYRLPRQPPGILIATYKGRRGHPTVFSFKYLEEIETWSADRRLNELAGMHPDEVRELAITTGPMPIDVNTPEDYDRLCNSQ